MLAASSPPSSSTSSGSDSTLLSPSSSSTSSSPSFSPPPNKTQKTMEEVWKDITINSLPNTPISHIHTIHHPNPSSHFKGIILQDFFSGAAEDHPTKNPSSSIHDSPLRRNRPTTATTTTTEFQFFDNELMNSESHQFHLQGNSSVPSFIAGVAAFDALASSSVLTSFGGGNGSGTGNGNGNGGVAFNKKRFCDGGGDEDASVDRKHKRMIKNRESAARSRARKQAYITELELEVAHLTQENAVLKKQQRQLIEAVPAQLPKKHSLHRTSTAPF